MLRKKGIKKFVTCDSLKGYRKRMSFHSLRVRSAYGAKQSVRVIHLRPIAKNLNLQLKTIAKNPNLEPLVRKRMTLEVKVNLELKKIGGAAIQRSVMTEEAQLMSAENTAARNVSTATMKRKDAQRTRTGTRVGQQ